MNKANWVVYIIRCTDDTLYTGITNDLDKRLQAHDGGTGAKYTKSRGPVELVYFELAANRSASLKREHAIKKLSRAEKLDLIGGLSSSSFIKGKN